MIQEYDIVKSLSDLNDRVLKDCKGTVLIVYPDFPPAYEVEFVNEVLETLDVLTVKADDIIKIT
jgi:hypothetical protein